MRLLGAIMAPNDLIAMAVLGLGTAVLAMVLARGRFAGLDMTLGPGSSGRSTPDDSQDPFEQQLLQGHSALQRGHLDQAITHYEQANQLQPGLPALLRRLARIHLGRQDLGQAMALLKQALASDPHHVSSRVDLAHCYLKSDQPREAQEHLAQVLNDHPDEASALRVMIPTLRQQGYEAQAQSCLERLMQLPQTSETTRLTYEFQQMEARFMTGDHSDELIEALETLSLRDGQRRHHYRHWAGQLQMRRGQTRKAVALWRAIVQEFGQVGHSMPRLQQLVASIKPALSHALGVLADEALTQGQAQAAQASLMEALALSPGESSQFELLGRVYETLSLSEKAQVAYQEALMLDPGNLSACQALARLMDEQQQWGLACDYHRRALVLEPESAESAGRLGACLGQLGQTQEAIRYLVQATRANPHHVGTLYNLAVALEQAGKELQAGAIYDRVLALEPDHVQAASNRLRLSQLLMAA